MQTANTLAGVGSSPVVGILGAGATGGFVLHRGLTGEVAGTALFWLGSNLKQLQPARALWLLCLLALLAGFWWYGLFALPMEGFLDIMMSDAALIGNWGWLSAGS